MATLAFIEYQSRPITVRNAPYFANGVAEVFFCGIDQCQAFAAVISFSQNITEHPLPGMSGCPHHMSQLRSTPFTGLFPIYIYQLKIFGFTVLALASKG